MKKKIMAFAPLIILSLVFTSCGNGGGFNPKRRDIELNRVAYANHSNFSGSATKEDNRTGFAKIAYGLKNKQLDSDSNFLLNGNGLGKGAMAINAEIDISGNGTIILADKTPIDINNIKGGLGDTVTTYWDIENKYVKSVDSLGGYNYIKGEKLGDGTFKYWRCFPTEIEGKKYRFDITQHINNFGGFENFVMAETTKNASTEFRVDSDYKHCYATGLDMSSFGGNSAEELEHYSSDAPTYTIVNSIAPGTLLTDVLFSFLLFKFTLLDIFDIASTLIDKMKLDVDMIDFGYDGESDGKNPTAALLDVGIKKGDLNNIKKVIDAIEEDPEYDITLPISIKEFTGNGTINYFLDYERNFVHQQEMVIDVTDTNLTLIPNPESSEPAPILIDIKDTDVRAIVNQEVTYDCVVDNINLDDYTPVEEPANPSGGLIL